MKISSVLAAKEEGDSTLDNRRVTLFGMIEQVKKKISKNGADMAFVTLEDISGAMEVLVFPNVYQKIAASLSEGVILRMSGRISVNEEQEPKLICEGIAGIPTEEELYHRAPAPHAAVQKTSDPAKAGLYLKFSGEDDPRYRKAMQYLAIFDGRTNVFLYFADRKVLKKVPPAMRVSLNDVLMRELCRLLGDENVAVRE